MYNEFLRVLNEFIHITLHKDYRSKSFYICLQAVLWSFHSNHQDSSSGLLIRTPPPHQRPDEWSENFTKEPVDKDRNISFRNPCEKAHHWARYHVWFQKKSELHIITITLKRKRYMNLHLSPRNSYKDYKIHLWAYIWFHGWTKFTNYNKTSSW